MMFLAYLFFFLIYLGASVALVRLAARAARSRDRKGWHWGLPVAVVLYLIPFWDHIPTWVIHKYLCATEAGFWVYKTPEQWRAENPGVAETLTWRNLSPQYKNRKVDFGLVLNERFHLERRRTSIFIFPVSLDKAVILDVLNGEKIVEKVSVWSGYSGGHYKIWVGSDICNPKHKEFGRLKRAFKEIGRQVQ
jgi:hypothetical protein